MTDKMMKKLKNVELIHLGDNVFCDYCNRDYTNSDEKGGMLFQSKAVCPKCRPDALKRIKGYGEERFIRAMCPDDVRFRDFVLQIRDGRNFIKIFKV